MRKKRFIVFSMVMTTLLSLWIRVRSIRKSSRILTELKFSRENENDAKRKSSKNVHNPIRIFCRISFSKKEKEHKRQRYTLPPLYKPNKVS